METTIPTKTRLAAELRKVAALASPENAAKYEAFARRAETGEFDDYADTYVCPITQLNNELRAAGFTKFAARVRNGEFDATKEESDAWAASPAGQATLKRFTPEARMAMFGQDDVFPESATEHTLGDGPVEGAYREQMVAIVQALDQTLNGQIGGPGRKTGFILLVFPFGDTEGRCNYMSNGANRQDVVTMLKEQIKRFEGQPDVTGRA